MTGEEIAAAAQLACLLEVSAPKPGNVSPERHFHDTRYEDFLASAVAIGPALARAGDGPLGATIRAAAEATARWTRSNTNLGIVLLLAPLARAAARPGSDLRARLAAVLEETTVADAAEAYVAIRLARPGGLGAASAEDVAAPPTVTLREAMALAAERDAIAREYTPRFGLTFEVGVPALAARLPDAWAALAVRAAAAVGAEYAGVDLLQARDGTTYVLEVNGIPGWQGLQEATGIDVAGALVDQVTRRGS